MFRRYLYIRFAMDRVSITMLLAEMFQGSRRQATVG